MDPINKLLTQYKNSCLEKEEDRPIPVEEIPPMTRSVPTPRVEGINDNERVTKTFRSLINKYFTPEILAELDIISERHDIDNNTKTKLMNAVLTREEIPYSVLGSGTNRYAVIIDGYAVKIALDFRGKTDNKREFVLMNEAGIRQYFAKCYEVTPTGSMATYEYVTIFSMDDFWENQEQMREILEDITRDFFIGDMGVSSKNYINWGKRSNGDLCILDYAYTYRISYHKLTCTCSDFSILEYDPDFNYLVCSECHRKFSFGEIRKRITKQDELDEIGDVKEAGIIMTGQVQTITVPKRKIKNYFDGDKKIKKKKDEFSTALEKREKSNSEFSIEDQMKRIFE